MRENFRWVLNRSLVYSALVFAPVSFIACNDTTVQVPPQPGSTPTVSPSPPASPSPIPTATVTTTPQPFPVPFPVPVPIPTHTVTPTPIPTPSPTQAFLPSGAYGGQDVLVTVGNQNTQFKFTCANGQVQGRIPTDDHGNFDVNGTYQPDSGQGSPPNQASAFQARYFGFVDNGHIHFDVTFRDQHGNAMDLTYDAFMGNPPDFTQVCSLVSPVPSGTPSASPMPMPSGSPIF